MKTKTYNVYTFAELSDKAKERAKNEFASVMGYSWGDDALASLKALAEHFDGKLMDWSVAWDNATYSNASFRMPEDMSPDEIAARLAKLGSFDPATLGGHGDCVLTGYCADDDAIDGFRRAWHSGERELPALMEAAFRSWLADAQSDYEGQFDDETFSETSDANGWEYDEDGNID